jgi:hypothetical protein
MIDDAAPFDALLDLDTRHDELLRQLEELDHRVQKVLAEYLPEHDPSLQSSANPDVISLEPPAAAA